MLEWILYIALIVLVTFYHHKFVKTNISFLPVWFIVSVVYFVLFIVDAILEIGMLIPFGWLNLFVLGLFVTQAAFILRLNRTVAE
jgi:hypothetical protein